ncbi:MAG: hypothetical protein JSS62_04705 [Verrucomicrobia bacterium]|nr:hypothetical protein [Verrucomicrobiota bacterium]MBS0645743.1 hypothetical protein [Verrucomicrobiota bacterium]
MTPSTAITRERALYSGSIQTANIDEYTLQIIGLTVLPILTNTRIFDSHTHGFYLGRGYSYLNISQRIERTTILDPAIGERHLTIFTMHVRMAAIHLAGRYTRLDVTVTTIHEDIAGVAHHPSVIDIAIDTEF